MMMGFVAAVALAVAYHFYTVNSLEGDLSDTKLDLVSANQRVSALEDSAAINEATIINLNNNIAEQAESITRLTNTNTIIERERDEYLGIFRRHNLTELARRKPGLIENRINSGTAEVFQDLIDTTTGVGDANP